MQWSHSSDQDLVLFCHPRMRLLADRIYEASEAKRQASSKPRRGVEFRDDIRWRFFEDGFPNIFIENVDSMAGRDVMLLVDLQAPVTIFEQLAVIYDIPRYLARSFTIVLPYFPTGTLERVDTEGQVVTASSLARVLSAVPQTPCGPPQLVIFDIHALQTRFYFGDTILPRLATAIPLLLSRMATLDEQPDDVVVAFPDDGAFKRFKQQFPPEMDSFVVCAKIRDGDRRVVTIKEGNPQGKHVIIVDDLVKTGGTLLECAKVVLKGGASRVSCFVTHAVFPQRSWERFLPQGGVEFYRFWTTESCPETLSEIEGRAPFELLSIAPILASLYV